ncbi:dephospho-CoA kinase [Aliiroseovarius sediminilitoris]|uniref:Dephospho-CoA kinase n=1 Tax=Aliiroseovarius sediminilitoris TaxID=1173584 RepID=A0A1I0MSY0_9RHOB|nr:dephospho-CoA kinase [Aliiroseovarius sediminilitoris]SEV91383.1 dephospho-CoA kinase [Aliiroseovarius sediminilitoris]
MNDPFIIGLTGSIGMGKSTTAAMFAQEGVPVWDADAAVHRIYAPGGAAVEPLRAICPEAIVAGAVDRGVLKDWIGRDSAALKRIEAVVHPLVAEDRADFIANAEAPIVVLDIPLLFETGTDAQVDLVVAASAPVDVQRERVLARSTMTEEQFKAILAKQMPDAEKRKRADVVIPTDTLEDARAAVKAVVAQVKERLSHA